MHIWKLSTQYSKREGAWGKGEMDPLLLSVIFVVGSGFNVIR